MSESLTLITIVEGLLFVSDGPVSLDRLTELLHEYDRASLRLALQELRDRYHAMHAGICLVEVAGGWQLRTVSDILPYLTRLVKTKPTRFSPSSLETLAIIAYRQPVTRQEIEYLRGVDAGAVIKTLLDRRLIKILGRKDIPGRPIIYGTSKEFLEVFNLKDLKQLPPLKDIESLDELPDFEIQEELPLKSDADSVHNNL